MKPAFYWHVHHDCLLEWCFDYDKRRMFIEQNKPECELILRLRLMQPVKGILPIPIIRIQQKLHHYVPFYCYTASHVELLKEHSETIEALHAIECPNCPWDGKTIFKKNGNVKIN